MATKIDQIDARIAALARMRGELARIVGCACASLDHCTCGAAYLARRGSARTVRPSLLHVTNGESAGNTLRQTALGGAVLSWAARSRIGRRLQVWAVDGERARDALALARPGDTATLEAARSAWAAFEAPEPTILAECATSDTAQLPFLAPALLRLLEELPALADGLSGTGTTDGPSRRRGRAHTR